MDFSNILDPYILSSATTFEWGEILGERECCSIKVGMHCSKAVCSWLTLFNHIALRPEGMGPAHLVLQMCGSLPPKWKEVEGQQWTFHIQDRGRGPLEAAGGCPNLGESAPSKWGLGACRSGCKAEGQTSRLLEGRTLKKGSWTESTVDGMWPRFSANEENGPFPPSHSILLPESGGRGGQLMWQIRIKAAHGNACVGWNKKVAISLGQSMWAALSQRKSTSDSDIIRQLIQSPNPAPATSAKAIGTSPESNLLLFAKTCLSPYIRTIESTVHGMWPRFSANEENGPFPPSHSILLPESGGRGGQLMWQIRIKAAHGNACVGWNKKVAISLGQSMWAALSQRKSTSDSDIIRQLIQSPNPAPATNAKA
ncbi:hypothetical protein BDK51DRAFT_32678 [Blyttiomyces helicus]|uniref:Uncharacterized protein n=1 Tax=Blyttiomyces helicus TaxID=388810 RepID=A0A4P9WGT8_9FUNG|nr:hypothetical protein BDK51DRAFT_32678 [Blyttiomyces helicus]|eukprot:RKO91924.1 hypothetical protein BDK51DRAFT_32678 [Blyttiomyces helicus]